MIKLYKIIEDRIEYSTTEFLNGDRFWYYKDKLHRKNGPAVEWVDGTRWWYKHGLLHREDGPAVITPNDQEEYWLNGIRYLNINSPEELLIASIII